MLDRDSRKVKSKKATYWAWVVLLVVGTAMYAPLSLITEESANAYIETFAPLGIVGMLTCIVIPYLYIAIPFTVTSFVYKTLYAKDLELSYGEEAFEQRCECHLEKEWCPSWIIFREGSLGCRVETSRLSKCGKVHKTLAKLKKYSRNVRGV